MALRVRKSRRHLLFRIGVALLVLFFLDFSFSRLISFPRRTAHSANENIRKGSLPSANGDFGKASLPSTIVPTHYTVAPCLTGVGTPSPPQHPEWALPGPDTKCKPRFHVALLKTYRCGSSALQNMLFRAADKHSLTVMVPAHGSTISRRPFRVEDVCHTKSYQLGYHVAAFYARWDHSQLSRLMPDDTVYISIVRWPVEQLVSMYHHLQRESVMSLENFTRQLTDQRFDGVFGRNQQLWDFGMPAHDARDENLVKKYLTLIEKHFDLILVADRMEESLILLSHLLCWPLDYVVSLQLNTLVNKTPPGKAVQVKIAEWQQGDNLLYEHFSKVLDKKIAGFGIEKMKTAVKELRSLNASWQKWCGFTRLRSSEVHHPMRWPDHVYSYRSKNETRTCTFMMLSEEFLAGFFRDGQFAVWTEKTAREEEQKQQEERQKQERQWREAYMQRARPIWRAVHFGPQAAGRNNTTTSGTGIKLPKFS